MTIDNLTNHEVVRKIDLECETVLEHDCVTVGIIFLEPGLYNVRTYINNKLFRSEIVDTSGLHLELDDWREFIRDY